MQNFKMEIVPFDEIIYKKCSFNILISVVLYFESSFYPIVSNDVVIYADRLDDMSMIPVTSIQIKNDEELLSEIGLILHAFDETQMKSLNDFIMSIKRRLITYEPIFTPVDLFEMGTRGRWNIHYKSNHFTHDVMVIGYNDTSREFYILDTNDRHCFEARIGYEDLYLCYKSYLSNCTWSPRRILSLHKDPCAAGKDKSREMYKKVFVRNMLAQKETVCENTKLLPAFCSHTQKLMSADIIGQEVVNQILTNHFLSTNLKYVQYYQIKLFYPEHDKLIDKLGEILYIYNMIKATFIKYSITYDNLLKRKMGFYFTELKKLEASCNDQIYNLLDKEGIK